MSAKFKKLAVFGLTGTVGASLASYLLLKENRGGPWPTVSAHVQAFKTKLNLPSRQDLIKCLESETFDVLIIGGGASGAGCALDAVTRGLNTALVEREDFAAGTSSRSTKLIHGGVRYLQKAIMKLDPDQYKMVNEALHERLIVINQAPHLSYPSPIIIPVYRWWHVPYFWFGLKMYDAVAGSHLLKGSYFLSKKNALDLFPLLRSESLCGGIVYYDGVMDDARMNLAIAMTAIKHGAKVVNHVSVTGLIKRKRDGKEVVTGAHVRDELTGKTWSISAKSVINATGPFTDAVRQMDNPSVKKICAPSSGVHITLPGYYCSDQMGLLDPATSDGRVIFFLPWQNHTIVGTTDSPCDASHNPLPKEEDISFILNEIRNYLDPRVDVRRGDVLSAWCGIRALISDPNKPDTQSIARNHIVHVSDSKLVTVAGGKWTTYRKMSSDTVDMAIKACNLSPTHSKNQTENIRMIGAKEWSPSMYIRLVQDFGMNTEVAQHLSQTYGTEAFAVAELASLTGKRWPVIGNKIHPDFPYIDAEVRYGVRVEYAMTVVDMISRRFRMSFLNVHAAQEALYDIADIMAEELKWTAGEKQQQISDAQSFLENDMGQNVIRATSSPTARESCRRRAPVKLSNDDALLYTKRFQNIDKDKKGYISVNDLRKSFKQHGEREIPCDELHEILKIVDTNMHGQIELDEYLQLMSAIKIGLVDYSNLVHIAEVKEMKEKKKILYQNIPVERSCGGI